jgi:hypothetical protein
MVRQYTFYALWRSFTQCWFVEDEGDIIFYLNKDGEVARRLKESDTPEKNLDACTAKMPPSTSKPLVGFSADAGATQDLTKTIELIPSESRDALAKSQHQRRWQCNSKYLYLLFRYRNDTQVMTPQPTHGP